MAFYHSNSRHPGSFNNLFRLLDEFDSYSQSGQSGHKPRKEQQPAHTFTPKFDLLETEHAYELYGELPGVDRSDITIEFVDPQAIFVAGSVRPHKATIEDVTDKPEQADAAKATDGHDTRQINKKEQPTPKYWVSERPSGEFGRTFELPSRIDQDNVTANLQNGILKIVVPKVKKTPHRRIAINVN